MPFCWTVVLNMRSNETGKRVPVWVWTGSRPHLKKTGQVATLPANWVLRRRASRQESTLERSKQPSTLLVKKKKKRNSLGFERSVK